MLSFLIRRIALALTTGFVVLTLVFAVVRILPAQTRRR